MIYAMEARKMSNGKPPPTCISMKTDHTQLTNEELHTLLCLRLPHMSAVEVTDEIRETIIAMLEVWD
ncbi:MAG TPA: hypothetical protein VGJ94_03770 [Syntrophorhabdaceae bacterium]|jgi:hypothetical protein